jgi:hypothetical protein
LWCIWILVRPGNPLAHCCERREYGLTNMGLWRLHAHLPEMAKEEWSCARFACSQQIRRRSPLAAVFGERKVMKKLSSKVRSAGRRLLGIDGSSADANAIGRTPASVASGLAAAAGSKFSTENMIENLEKRELLFNLTVDAADPSFVADQARPGWGTVTRVFAYFAPVLTNQLPTISQNQGTGLQLPTPPAGPDPALAETWREQAGFAAFGGPGGNQPWLSADQIPTDFPQVARNRMTSYLESRIAGALLTLYGPLDVDPNTPGPQGASVRVVDLYGRPMVPTLALGRISPLAAGPQSQNIFDNLDGDQDGTVNIGTGTKGVYGNIVHDRVDPSSLEAFGDLGADAYTFDEDGNFVEAAFPTLQTALRPGQGGGQGSFLAFVNDPTAGDGVPDINDGIGGIIVTRGDGTTRIAMNGGTVTRLTEAPTDGNEVDVFDQFGGFAGTAFNAGFTTGYAMTFSGELTGALPGILQRTGYGFALLPGQAQPTPTGFPSAGGSVLIGAHFVRDNTDSTTYYNANFDSNAVTPTGGAQQLFVSVPGPQFPVRQGPSFTEITIPSQVTINGVDITINNAQGQPATLLMGISTLPGTNISLDAIAVNGTVLGRYTVGGSLGRFAVTHMLGSLAVSGDLGDMYVGGRAGFWNRADQLGTATALDTLNPTGSVVNVGGSAGRIAVAGRSLMQILIQGDTATPRPRVDYVQYTEREELYNGQTYGFNPFNLGEVDPERLYNTIWSLQSNSSALPQAIFYGGGNFRNDLLASAEFVGSGVRGAVITGDIGTIDMFQALDASDSFGFAAEAGQTITLDFDITDPTQNAALAYLRVFNSQKELIAASRAADDPRAVNTPRGQRITFVAPATGVYYFVVATQDDGQFASQLGYQVTLTGQAATTLGQALFGGGGRASFIQVSNGAVGQIAFGRQIVDTAGETYFRPGTTGSVDPSGIPVNEYYRTGTANSTPTLDVRGTLYDFTASGDVQNVILTVGRDLGQFNVGGLESSGQAADDLAPLTNPFGSLVNATVNVGGQVGRIEVARSTGFNDFDWIGRGAGTPGGTFALNTGLAFNTTFRPGHIGALIFNDAVNGGSLAINVSDNARIDLIEVRDDRTYDVATRTGFEISQPSIIRGQGADVRFMRFLSCDLVNPGQTPLDNFFLPLNPGVNTFTDDSGVTFTIELTGVGSTGRVRAIPVGTGLAIGRIEVEFLDERGGLTVRTTAPGSLALGEIVVNGVATPERPHQIRFTGVSEIDVRQIFAAGAISVENTTPGGDIVAIQAGFVARVNISGNLGSANTFALGARDLAPRLTFGQLAGLDREGTVNGAPGELVAWRYVARGDVFILEDSGFVADRVLNGIFAAAINEVIVQGSVGDVIATAPDGFVARVTANSDRSQVPGAFDGIVGTIYGSFIGRIDVGDGLAATGASPFAAAGIFAPEADGVGGSGVIQEVSATRMNGATIRGAIAATNAIGSINLRNASAIGATIHAANLDNFWFSARWADTGTDGRGESGLLDSITIQGGSLIASDLFAQEVDTISIRGGGWDATSLESGNNINSIRADFFRSTLTNRQSSEFLFNQIRTRLNIGSISVNNTREGDMSDLIISTGGFLTGSISARNIIRSNFDLRAGANAISATNDIRATFIGSSRLQSVSAGGDIRTSSIITTGAILGIRATGEITDTQITSTGPDGRVNSLTAGGQISGAITTSGPIGTISNRFGDVVLAIRQTDPIDATISRITAGRDLVLALDLAPGANIGTLQAGRHVGRILPDGTQPDSLDITGNIGTIRATGVIYSDVRVGGTIGSITMGRPLGQLIGADFVSNAQIVAANRINSVSINGDFDGSIISYSNGIGSVSIRNGSFRQGTVNAPNQIAAYAGDIGTVSITKGHLLGNVIAFDGSINTINVTGDTIFGNIGYNPTLSPATRTNVLLGENRGQLPPDAPFAGGIVGTPGRDGPTIRAALDIRSIRVSGGIYEAAISAGRALNSVNVTGGIDHLGTGASADDATFIVAGDSLGTVSVRSLARGTVFGAGFASLGADGVVGGADGTANGDTLRQGSVRAITLSGGSENVLVIGGVSAGVDGVFANLVTGVDPGNDNRAAPGSSTVGSVTVRGTASNTWVLAESGTPRLSTNLAGRVVRESQPNAEFITAGNPGVTIERTRLTTTVGTGGPAITIQHSGPGRAFYDAATRQLTLVGTTSGTSIRITPGAGVTSISGLTILGGDDVALGTLDIGVDVVNLDMRVDGEVRTLKTRNTTWTAGNENRAIRSGVGFSSITMGFANQNSDLRILTPGNVGTLRALGSILIGANVTSRLQALNVNSINVAGNFGGLISSDRDIRSVTIGGGMTFNSAIRAGLNIGSVSATELDGAFISAGGDLSSVNIRGTVDSSSIYAGVDLGSDGRLGGTGSAGDRTSTGDLRSVSVGGNFTRSNISAGVYAAGDGFIGSADDRSGDGRSVLGTVTIRGSATGSAFNSESFGFRSSGSLGNIRVQNRPFGNIGNLTSGRIDKTPAPVVVNDLILGELGGEYTLTINFNQSVDPSTILPRFDQGTNALLFAGAISLAEIRGSEPINQFFNLTPGTDYTVRLSPDNEQVIITFSQTVTSRALAIGGILPNAAAPGLFRVTIDSTILRGQSENARLDGDRDGIVELNDNFSQDTILGDAGDRYGVFQTQDSGGNTINFYGPINLDVLLSPNNGTPNAPTINQTATIRGVMGDHPNTNPLSFTSASDVDTYAISLQAGQILELGNLTGAAVNALLEVADIDGNYLLQIDPNTGQRVVIRGLTQLSPTSFLVLETGQYFLVVSTDSTTDRDLALAGEQPLLANPNDPAAPLAAIRGPIVGNLPTAAPGTLGTYAFTVRISVDGDSGGGDESDSGDGDQIASIPNASTVADAPLPAAFPVIADFDGPDNIFGNVNDTVPLPVNFRGPNLTLGDADDPLLLTLGDFRWVYDRGPNGVANGNGAVGNPSDDRIVGKRINPIAGQANQEIYLLSGVDGVFGTADDQFALYQNGFLWQRNAGPNGVFNGNGAAGAPSDDIVIGVEAVAVFGSNGINTVRVVSNPNEQRRVAGADGIFGTTDDRTFQAPAPSEFAGTDGILGNGDDIASITRNGIVWTVSSGNNAVFNGNGTSATPSDDVVIGTQSNGQKRTVSAGFDGVFGTADDRTKQAPLPSEFAGPDGTLGTFDDLQIISRGQYDWTLDRGPNNRIDGNAPARGGSDDLVIGVNRFGSKQILVAGPDGRFGTSDDRITIQSAIGRINNIGAVVDPTGDVDVFKLNGGSVIQSGSRYRITFRINEFGGDPGLNTIRPLSENGDIVTDAGLVDRFPAIQFGLFDVSGIFDLNAPAVQQAALLAAPSNAYAFNGTANTILASDGITTYGYDEQGDLYMDVLFGGSLLDPTQAGRYAVVVEAPQSTGYNVEIRRLADRTEAVVPQTQNILLEITGGEVAWLEAFGSRVIEGFSGLTQSRVPLFDGLGAPLNTTVRDYTVANLLANLNAVFTAALGPNVIRFSTSAAAFAGQDFSTIFITDSPESAARAGLGFTGQSQGVDVYNANRNDQAVVFAAPLNVFAGNLPTQAGIDRYTRQLTAAVAFRIGELLGLRQVESPAGGTNPFPVMADNSDTATPGNIANLAFANQWRTLSQTSGESRFSIGFQNDQALIRRIFQLSGA